MDLGAESRLRRSMRETNDRFRTEILAEWADPDTLAALVEVFRNAEGGDGDRLLEVLQAVPLRGPHADWDNCRHCGQAITYEAGAWFHRFAGQDGLGTRGCNAAHHDRLERRGRPWSDRYDKAAKATPPRRSKPR